ncbi:MAG: hypothetical protein B7X02_01480 [Rhodospirillales bacterium 12-54-5]|nr:MAG: hypothetical protein B7X02_01480 [Rhodospirillales bacterium 12-54-5]
MRFLLSILLTATLLWLAAFAVFAIRMHSDAASADEKSDALVVLTGGKSRVDRGFALLAEGSAPVLLVSGVGQKVTVEEMLNQHATPAIKSAIIKHGGEIIFDYDASTTQTNAENSAAFIRAHHYKTIRLITAHYHMPRSLLEFHTALPEVTILAEPVVPEEFSASNWWETPATRRLVLQEFHKYLAAHLRMKLQAGR